MPATKEERELIQAAAKRLRTGIVAIVCGMVCGTGLFVATVLLLIRGGPLVGQNLALLGHYFPGYDVTWVGAFIGLFYGTLFGGVLGYSTAWVYNSITQLRAKRRDEGLNEIL